MNKIGKQIYNHRIAANIEIEKVAQILKIRKKYIIAIENDDVDSFRTKAYYVGYLKQYLQLLNLDYKNIESLTNSAKNQDLSIPSPIFESLSPNIVWTIASLLMLIITYNLCSYLINKPIIAPYLH